MLGPEFFQKHLGKAAEQLSAAERLVVERTKNRLVVATDVNAEFTARSSFGDRLADQIAKIGGSWGFIIFFFLFLSGWAIINVVILTRDAFDPYPFVFLNLILSMLAAIQAPIIMMSQNRQAERDRFEATKDYEVNLKAELGVLALHQKIDMQVLTELAALREEVGRLTEKLDQAKG